MAITTTNISTVNTITYISAGNSAITMMTICNHTASPVSVDVYVVPNGASASNDNIFLKNLEILAEDTFVIYEGGEKLVLGNNDYISCSASTSGALTAITSTVSI